MEVVALTKVQKKRCIFCFVCNSPTSISHLQANVCAACSAFYRRSIKLSKNFICQRNTKNCNLSIKNSTKSLCRYCRFQKCLQAGIKFQKSKFEDVLPQQLETPLFEDFDYVFKYVFGRFKQPVLCPKLSSLNFTDEFGKLMTNFMEIFMPKEPPILIKDEALSVSCTKSSFINIAQMLLAYSPFAALPYKDKVLMHHEFWQIFFDITRVYQTFAYYGTNLQDSRMLADSFQYRDHSNPEQISTSDVRATFLVPFKERIKTALGFFKTFNPTFFEFAHVCQVMLWSRYELMNLSDTTNKLAEKIMDELSQDLHRYYTNELKLECYASRQAKLYRMITVCNTINREEKQMYKAGEIFNFGKGGIPCCPFKSSYYNFVNKNHI